MWKLLWFRKRTYEVWIPATKLLVLAMDCPFQFNVYEKKKNRNGRTVMRVKFIARPSVVSRYMSRKRWTFFTYNGLVYEIGESN